MNKKLKTGLIIAIGAGLAGWGIYSQMPKTNEELAEMARMMSGGCGGGCGSCGGGCGDHDCGDDCGCEGGCCH